MRLFRSDRAGWLTLASAILLVGCGTENSADAPANHDEATSVAPGVCRPLPDDVRLLLEFRAVPAGWTIPDAVIVLAEDIVRDSDGAPSEVIVARVLDEDGTEFTEGPVEWVVEGGTGPETSSTPPRGYNLLNPASHALQERVAEDRSIRAWPDATADAGGWSLDHPAVATARECLAAGSSAQSQLIPDRTTCEDCTVRVEETARFGGAGDEGELWDVLRVGQTAHGYWAFSWGELPRLYSLAGEFRRTIGEHGEGPGEMQVPSDVVQLHGDSVLVLDQMSLHLLDQDLSFVRTFRAPLLGISFLLAPQDMDGIIANANDPTPDRFGLPLHVLSLGPDGSAVDRSFGEGEEPITPSTSYTRLSRALAESADGGYWVLHAHQYDVEKRDSNHEVETTLSRRPDWFAEESDLLPGGPDTAPSPRCIGVWEDEQGRVWTACLVPSPDFRQAWTDVAEQIREEGTTEVAADRIDSDRLYHTHVEVLDPTAGTLLASTRLESRAVSVPRGGRVAVTEMDSLGFRTVRILEFSLVEASEHR